MAPIMRAYTKKTHRLLSWLEYVFGEAEALYIPIKSFNDVAAHDGSDDQANI